MFRSKTMLQGQFSQEFQLFFCHAAFYSFFGPEKCPEKGQFLSNPETFTIEHKTHYHEDTHTAVSRVNLRIGALGEHGKISSFWL